MKELTLSFIFQLVLQFFLISKRFYQKKARPYPAVPSCFKYVN
ncbi:hypothetical protein CU011_0955 [Enterococcus faecium]|nr:hypothetical protein HMPREF1347_02090 [Enterococcus faecium 504]EPI08848.1 hypothetical protein D357_01729 [Enterococcus faecium SD3B-2]MBK4756914.1 hypothetical protein [Enterococcus faecium]MBK4806092.1 hypothetical protein [Enterococcus faecium]MBK4809746.1 hypothetical protein [Enterococcus faecium]